MYIQKDYNHRPPLDESYMIFLTIDSLFLSYFTSLYDMVSYPVD